MKLPKRTPQPTLKTRVEKLVQSLVREWAMQESMRDAAQSQTLRDSCQGRMNAIQHVLDVLQPLLAKWPSKNVRKTAGASINMLTMYCTAQGEVPSIDAPGEPSETRSERITYKRLSSQVAMLLKDLPEED